MFKEGPPKFPRRAIWIGIAALAVLGIGGAFADHSFNITSSTPPSTTLLHGPRIPKTLAGFVGLRILDHRPAPSLDLVDQYGSHFNLHALSGRVVVLTFLDPRCADICPVVSAELRDATIDLGDHVRSVTFVVVNTNPGHLGLGALGAAINHDRLGSLPRLYFLSGPLRVMNKIWTSYGVTVEYDPTTGRVAHTNVIYVIGPTGRLDYSLGPFGNESFAGTFSLSPGEIRRFADGIAQYVRKAAA